MEINNVFDNYLHLFYMLYNYVPKFISYIIIVIIIAINNQLLLSVAYAKGL